MNKVANAIFAIMIASVSCFFSDRCDAADPATQPTTEKKPPLSRLEVAPGKPVEYLVIEPGQPTAVKDRWMVVFLPGAGGSAKAYNLSRPVYAKIREALSRNGAYIVVPSLGPLHCMNDQAKESLTKIIDKVLTDNQINARHVHIMGTSMGAGSALAYAVNYPDRIRSVCSIMPMTDFAVWGREIPSYGEGIRVSYGGTYEEKPETYDANSARKRADALAKIPVLLIHGTADSKVPFSHSEKLAAILQAKRYSCKLIRVENAGHKEDFVADLQDQIAKFLIDANAEGDTLKFKQAQ